MSLADLESAIEAEAARLEAECVALCPGMAGKRTVATLLPPGRLPYQRLPRPCLRLDFGLTAALVEHHDGYTCNGGPVATTLREALAVASRAPKWPFGPMAADGWDAAARGAFVDLPEPCGVVYFSGHKHVMVMRGLDGALHAYPVDGWTCAEVFRRRTQPG